MVFKERKNRFGQLARFYQAGVVNTLFGFALYALLVWVGMNMYGAQFFAHFTGVIFNYFTYSRYAFRDKSASRIRFFASYVSNYLLGVGMLLLTAHVITNPYAAMAVAILIYTAANYFVLKRFVFNRVE